MNEFLPFSQLKNLAISMDTDHIRASFAGLCIAASMVAADSRVSCPGTNDVLVGSCESLASAYRESVLTSRNSSEEWNSFIENTICEAFPNAEHSAVVLAVFGQILALDALGEMPRVAGTGSSASAPNLCRVLSPFTKLFSGAASYHGRILHIAVDEFAMAYCSTSTRRVSWTRQEPIPTLPAPRENTESVPKQDLQHDASVNESTKESRPSATKQSGVASVKERRFCSCCC